MSVDYFIRTFVNLEQDIIITDYEDINYCGTLDDMPFGFYLEVRDRYIHKIESGVEYHIVISLK